MHEKRWKSVPPQAFTSDGTARGQLTVADASLFKVKQIITLSASAQPNISLEVKSVDSITLMHIGPIGGSIKAYTDISAYTVLASAFIFANEQERSSVPEQSVERFTYEEEPTVARRVILVDKLGNKIDQDNPLPVDVEVIIPEVTVNLDAFSSPPDNAMSVGTENGTTGGTAHVINVDSELKLRVKDVDAISAIEDVKAGTDHLDVDLSTVATETTLGDIKTSTDHLDADLSTLATEATLGDIKTSTDHLDVDLSTLATQTTLAEIKAKTDHLNVDLSTVATETTLSNVNNKLNSLGQKGMTGSVPVVLASDQAAIPVDATIVGGSLTVDLDAFSSTPDNVMLVGSKDGSKTGDKFGFINNAKSQILAADDRVQRVTYADFGTKDQRITRIDYTSATFPGITARKAITYTLVGNRYRRDEIDWILI